MTGNESFRSPFLQISLSSSDKRELQRVAKTILDANFDRYLRFSSVEPSMWKLIKEKDGIQVYSGRKEQKRSPHHIHSSDDSELQSLLCVGSTPGALDDMMHGALDSTRGVNDASVNDFSDAAVLQSIKIPTAGDPFKSVVLKWMELDARRRSMGLIKNRDYVYVEATGTRFMPNDERVGYHIMHSVGVPKAYNLPGRVRSELSVCSFYRQVNETSVSIYSMAMMDPMSDRVRQVVVPRFVKMLLSTFTHNDVGKVKKFAQTLSKRYSELDNRLPNADQNCITCSKRVWRLAKLTSRHNTCTVCCGYVCNACKIDKKLKPPTPDTKVAHRKVAFCFSCLTDVMTANESEFSFVEDSSDVPEVTRRVHDSVWQTRLPSWSFSKNNESPTNFASMR